MNITVIGTIEKKDFGNSTWALVSTEGKTYELHSLPSPLQNSHIKVKILGKLRPDIMTLAMIGPVLEVIEWNIIS